jgi:hypothetical protein
MYELESTLPSAFKNYEEVPPDFTNDSALISPEDNNLIVVVPELFLISRLGEISSPKASMSLKSSLATSSALNCIQSEVPAHLKPPYAFG